MRTQIRRRADEADGLQCWLLDSVVVFVLKLSSQISAAGTWSMPRNLFSPLQTRSGLSEMLKTSLTASVMGLCVQKTGDCELFFSLELGAVAKWNTQQSLLLWTHQLFGSAACLLSAECIQVSGYFQTTLSAQGRQQLHTGLLFWRMKEKKVFAFRCFQPNKSHFLMRSGPTITTSVWSEFKNRRWSVIQINMSVRHV